MISLADFTMETWMFLLYWTQNSELFIWPYTFIFILHSYFFILWKANTAAPQVVELNVVILHCDIIHVNGNNPSMNDVTMLPWMMSQCLHEWCHNASMNDVTVPQWMMSQWLHEWCRNASMNDVAIPPWMMSQCLHEWCHNPSLCL